jgi:hypothetical protein
MIGQVGMSPGVQPGRLQQNSLADQAASMLSPAWLLPGLAWLRALIYAELPLLPRNVKEDDNDLDNPDPR